VLGIDVSNVNGSIAWSRIAPELDFAFAKATEGLGFVDSNLGVNRAGARAHGVPLGLYHFARPDRRPNVAGARAEAQAFVRAIGPLAPGELRPVLDFEHPGGISGAGMTVWAGAFLAEVERLTGVRPIFYSYPSFISSTMSGARGLADYPLWLASYGPNDGHRHTVSLVGSWKKIAVHQFTSNGRMPGAASRLDLNFSTSVDPLRAHPAVPVPKPLLVAPRPLPAWFWDWAGWRIAVNELGDKGALKAHRPKSAPRMIPPWAWVRLQALLRSK
jgi:lysozyme